MSENLRKTLLRCVIAAALGLLFAVTFLWNTGLFDLPASDRYRLLSDAFLIPGFFMVGTGLLIWMSNDGMFLGVSFVLSRAVSFLLPFARLGTNENYRDYTERKSGKKVKGYSFLFFTGVLFLAISAVFVLLFQKQQV